jgi:hypothetical protein
LASSVTKFAAALVAALSLLVFSSSAFAAGTFTPDEIGGTADAFSVYYDVELDPSIVQAGGAIDWDKAFADFMPDTTPAAEEWAKRIFARLDQIAESNKNNATLGAEYYEEIGQLSLFDSSAMSNAVAEGSADVVGGVVPKAIVSTIGDGSLDIASKFVSVGAGALFSSLVFPDATSIAGDVVTSAPTVTGLTFTSNVQPDGSIFDCFDRTAAAASAWQADCSRAWSTTNNDTSAPNLITAAEPGKPEYLTSFDTPNGPLTSAMWDAPNDPCADFQINDLPGPFEIVAGAPQNCDGTVPTSGPAAGQPEAAYLPGPELGVGPPQLGTPPVDSQPPADLTVPTTPPDPATVTNNASDYLSNDNNDGNDLKKQVQNVIDPTDNPDPGAETGTVPDCTGMTGDQCVTALQDAGYNATIGGTVTDCPSSSQPDPNGIFQDSIGWLACTSIWANLDDPAGRAEVLSSAGGDYAPRPDGAWVECTYCAVSDPLEVGAPVKVWTEPPNDVAPCAFADYSGGTKYGLYPISSDDCVALLKKQGFSDVHQAPTTDPNCQADANCGTDCSVDGDPQGTVEGISTDGLTYDDGLGRAVPLATPLYVYSCPAPQTTTGTTTDPTTDTSTDPTTDTSTDPTTTGTNTTSTDPTTTGTNTTSTDPTTTGTDTTSTNTTTTGSSNCVVADTCTPPDPFTPPTVDGISFPSIATPCNVFPFGVPCYVIQQIEAINASPVAPDFTVGLPTGHGHSASVTVNANDLPVDVRTIFSVVRTLFLVMTGTGVVMWLVRRHGSGGSGGDNAGDSFSEGDGD